MISAVLLGCSPISPVSPIFLDFADILWLRWLLLLVFIRFPRFSSMFLDFLRFSLILFDCRWFAWLLAGFRRFSATSPGFLYGALAVAFCHVLLASGFFHSLFPIMLLLRGQIPNCCVQARRSPLRLTACEFLVPRKLCLGLFDSGF